MDAILRTAEEDLIQTWRDRRQAAPTSPLAAASDLAMYSLMFTEGAKTFPHRPHPSEAKFAERLNYILEKYDFSPDFPYSKEQIDEDIAIKLQRNIDKLREAREGGSAGT